MQVITLENKEIYTNEVNLNVEEVKSYLKDLTKSRYRQEIKEGVFFSGKPTEEKILHEFHAQELVHHSIKDEHVSPIIFGDNFIYKVSATVRYYPSICKQYLNDDFEFLKYLVRWHQTDIDSRYFTRSEKEQIFSDLISKVMITKKLYMNEQQVETLLMASEVGMIPGSEKVFKEYRKNSEILNVSLGNKKTKPHHERKVKSKYDHRH